MAKKIFYDDEARTRILAGAKALYDAVKVTYGPKGGNVVLDRLYGGPIVTHDGVTVAEAIELPSDTDELLGQEVGAKLIKQAASKLNKEAGDGTTTVTVLTYSILVEANRLIAAGHNPQELKKSLEKAGAEVVEMIGELAEMVEGNNKRVAEVASISAGDEVIGKLIADVVSKIGKDGEVTVEPSQGLNVESEITEGYTFGRGWASQYFVNIPTDQQAVHENAAVIVTTTEVVMLSQIVPIIEKIVAAGKHEVVLIADKVDHEALNMLIVNKLKGALKVTAINAPSYGDHRVQLLEDICAVTGAQLIGKGVSIEDAELEHIGYARKMIVSKDSTTIVRANDKELPKEDFVTYVQNLQEQHTNQEDEYEKAKLQKRIAALDGKVAVIKVGGATETEINEKKFRVDDAVAATKAALAEGIVAGGGVTLVNVAKQLETDGEAGRSLLKKALMQPFVQIMENAGQNSQALLAEVEKANKVGFGINVSAPEKGLVDMKAAGVIDPARVTKQVVQNAVSIAATAVTMGALVVEIPEPAPTGAMD